MNGLSEPNGFDDDADDFCLHEHTYTGPRTCQSQTEDFYARQSQVYANFRQVQPSPAFFQPGFYQRSHTPQPQIVQDPLQSSHSQNVFGHYHHQQQQQQQQIYFSRQPSYYASWYGSTPSLRIPDRNANRQSFYFNWAFSFCLLIKLEVLEVGSHFYFQICLIGPIRIDAYRKFAIGIPRSKYRNSLTGLFLGHFWIGVN